MWKPEAGAHGTPWASGSTSEERFAPYQIEDLVGFRWRPKAGPSVDIMSKTYQTTYAHCTWILVEMNKTKLCYASMDGKVDILGKPLLLVH